MCTSCGDTGLIPVYEWVAIFAGSKPQQPSFYVSCTCPAAIAARETAEYWRLTQPPSVEI